MAKDLSALRNYFDPRNCGIHPLALCSANRFHFDLDHKGATAERLITWNDSPKVFRSVDISSIPFEGKYLSDWITQFMADFLRDLGLHIPFGVEEKLKASLLTAYELRTCLCYAETFSRSGVKEECMVTKSAEVIYEFRSRLAPSERKKSEGRFQEQFNTSYSELESGIFDVVKVINEADGFHLKKHRLNTRNTGFLIPSYSIINWADAVARYLKSGQVILSYTDDSGCDHDILTTLDPQVLGIWMNMNPAVAFYRLRADWGDSILNAMVSVPDSGCRHRFVSIPLLGIRKISMRQIGHTLNCRAKDAHSIKKTHWSTSGDIRIRLFSVTYMLWQLLRPRQKRV